MKAKTLTIRSLVCAIALFGAGQALAETATASVGASVLTPIAITKVDDLAFGNFMSTTGGTIVLTPTATALRTPSAGVTLDNTVTPKAAKFTVGGTAGATFSITLPTTVSLSNGPNTMDVGTFTSDLDLAAATIPVGGTIDMYVGGTLTVGAAQANGAYTGTFDVSVNYN